MDATTGELPLFMTASRLNALPQVGRDVSHAHSQERHDGALAAAEARALGGAAP